MIKARSLCCFTKLHPSISAGNVNTLSSSFVVKCWRNGQIPIRKASSRSESSYVVKSPYPDIQLPTDDIYSLISKRFLLHGSRIGLIDGASGREYSYSEIAETTVKFASGLQRLLSYNRGDVLAVVLPTMPQYATICLGTLAAGGVVTTCNPTFSAEQLAYHFKSSNAKLVATIPAMLPTVREAVAKSGAGKIIVVDDTDTAETKNNCIAYHSLVADSGSRFNPITTKPDDVRVLAYTSGTTLPGIPKGCMLTNRSVGANILQLQHPDLLDLNASKVMLAVSPFFHSIVHVLLAPLFAGTKVVTLPKFEPHTFFTTIQQYGVKTSILLPPLLRFFAKDPVVDRYNITTLSDILTGAAPIGKDIMKVAGQRLHCKLVRKAYGLTETSPLTHIMPQSLGMQEAESIGYCIQNMKAKVVDLESGNALPPNEKGEVWLQGPNVMKGYLNNTRATQECLTEDGWFKTGDIGHYNESGLFYIFDRVKEVIKVGDFQISPSELESVLLSHPKIVEAAVIGIEDHMKGEAPMGFVVKSGDVREKEIQDFVSAQVSKHQHLVKVVFIDEIPKSPSGKILRRVLKSEFEHYRKTATVV